MTLNDYSGENKGVVRSHAECSRFIHRTYLERIVNGIASTSPARRERGCVEGKADQTACKPGSVPPPKRRGGHSSGPTLAGRFSRPTRTPRAGDGSTGQFPEGLGWRGIPIRSCSWRGLPCGPCHQRPGALLPHPFTLTAPWSRRAKAGGLLSVALSLGLPPVGVTHRHVVVEPGLSSSLRPRPPGRLIRAERGRPRPSGQADKRNRAISRARVSPSATPSTPSGRQCRWNARTTAVVAASNLPDGGRS